MRCWQWVENHFGSMNTRVLDERKFKGSGSKVLDHKGKKNGLRKKGAEKNHLQAALVMGRKEAGDTHPGAPLPSSPKQNPASFVWGFFSCARSLDQKESSNAICSLQRALSAKRRRVHTLEHLFQEAT